ncbi:aspartate/glutamate racemase family protein [Dehalogenimonas etheniformans]|uniref:Aspartate/glutamate racemase family protein n=1 Tax=Dehalogenimonas etheniformans TaxID=1536648 RepID=A0A2P5P5G7_9CHLR|nr:aspartate/glutamate racemase family protein [Dehalogenimonas etheniformans]PPD57536.1 aspartate/glutamate racemase family protein [Dehalogenimonas etheniformans]QNT76897.1 aspartate/glutamate racemase family protein [Dehalogenimonas etheniformans]
MKTIGLIGGISWNSTALYYKLINEGVAKTLGGLHSAKVLMYSFDFEEIEKRQSSGDWHELGAMLGERGKALKDAGADFLVICANTMHKVVEQVEAISGLAVLHIADAAGESIKKAGLKKVGLLGTRFTMSEDFYRRQLEERFGLEVLVPEKDQQYIVNSIIYDELCRGCVQEASNWACQLIIDKLVARGAEGIVLACTELPMLIKPSDMKVPLFDTVKLHAGAAVRRAVTI